MKQREFKVGDEVFSIQLGKDTVTKIHPAVKVHFSVQVGGHWDILYTKDGRYREKDAGPSLFHLDDAIRMGLCHAEPLKWQADDYVTNLEPPYASVFFVPVPASFKGKNVHVTIEEIIE